MVEWKGRVLKLQLQWIPKRKGVGTEKYHPNCLRSMTILLVKTNFKTILLINHIKYFTGKRVL